MEYGGEDTCTSVAGIRAGGVHLVSLDLGFYATHTDEVLTCLSLGNRAADLDTGTQGTMQRGSTVGIL
ncbi:hypothetical protein [Gordonia sp. NPDC003950]